MMYKADDHPLLVPFDGSFRISDARTEPPRGAPDKSELVSDLEETVTEIRELQERLYAENQTALLLVFQAMDAAGKDGTIAAVMTGVNPAGCQVYSFKKPSENELEHDFLWRHAVCLPERGRIGIFNRSWYEEVLVVRVHPEFLDGQRLPWRPKKDRIWDDRLESIADYERHLARNGTVIVKFFLNVSKDEQKRRFLARIDERGKNWKFQEGDVREREHREAYMDAYEAALNATSRPWAPWYVVPADNKAYMRREVARIVVQTLEGVDPKFPELDEAEAARLEHIKELLQGEKD